MQLRRLSGSVLSKTLKSAVNENINTVAIVIATGHPDVTETEMAIDIATETEIATRNDIAITARDTTIQKTMATAINDRANLGRMQTPKMIHDTGTVADIGAGQGKASADAIARKSRTTENPNISSLQTRKRNFLYRTRRPLPTSQHLFEIHG